MPASSERDRTCELLSGVNPGWLGNSVWQVPDLKVSRIKSWPSITVMSYRRGGGESIWRGDRHRMTVFLDQLPPVLVQVEQGPTWELPPAAPGTLSFCPPDVTPRSVTPEAWFIQVAWDTGLYSALLRKRHLGAKEHCSGRSVNFNPAPARPELWKARPDTAQPVSSFRPTRQSSGARKGSPALG